MIAGSDNRVVGSTEVSNARTTGRFRPGPKAEGKSKSDVDSKERAVSCRKRKRRERLADLDFVKRH